MSDSQQRADHYRKLFARLDKDQAQTLIDRLQVLALTRPDAVKELETFLERDEPPAMSGAGETGRNAAGVRARRAGH